jgi:hypothetical protein
MRMAAAAGPAGRSWSDAGVGLGHPVPQARLADIEVFRGPGERCGALAGKLDGALPELRRVRRRHGLDLGAVPPKSRSALQ